MSDTPSESRANKPALIKLGHRESDFRFAVTNHKRRLAMFDTLKHSKVLEAVGLSTV